MTGFTFGTQDGKAYYYNRIPDFINDDSSFIMGELVKHTFGMNDDQRNAWANQIGELQTRLADCGMTGDIIFEYDIVRLGKRIDVILLIRHMVFSLEFKNGKKAFVAKDAQQAEDYAIDIKNFHKESENLYVCPILIATDAAPCPNQVVGNYKDKQIFLQKENIETLVPKLKQVASKYGEDIPLDFDKWFNSPYYPTPTIVDAAVEAYGSKNLTSIAHSEAGQQDIDACETELQKIIEYAKSNKRKCLCFVTGVPGAGKTLVGLDVATKSLAKGMDNLSVYLSGNLYLVSVLREALTRSSQERDKEIGKKRSKKDYATAVRTFIQGSFEFRKDNMTQTDAPVEHVIIFDEAQRVWNREKMRSWTSSKQSRVLEVSEPHFLLDVLNRHKDWAVFVCLVGLGQDIYDGEVGIQGWFDMEEMKPFKEQGWEWFVSPEIVAHAKENNITPEEFAYFVPQDHMVKALHLPTSIRSFRSDRVNKFVSALLGNDVKSAKCYYEALLEKYPIFVTRDLKKAKAWAKAQVRGSQRCGMLACSSAQRLKAEGVFVPTELNVEDWFLAPTKDLRSSNMMEMVANEFKIQGLEIDWAVVCWDADLRRKEGEWDYYKFTGPRWNHRNQAIQQRYLLNAYRVLLTRARQGMIIFVPEGDLTGDDETRNPQFYDGIYQYLRECGIRDWEGTQPNTLT